MEAVQLGRAIWGLSSEWKWSSAGEKVVGFKYLRKAGSGRFIECCGRLSSVY